LAGALGRTAATDSYAGHLVFVPLVSAIILWTRRDRFPGSTSPANPTGFALAGVGLAMLGLAHASQSHTAHVASLVLTLAGLGLWLNGPGWLRPAIFPIGFLLLLVPPSQVLVQAVSPSIQRFVAGFSAGTLTLLRIPVEQQGFVLRLPGATLSIDQGCNGLRFLLVLFVIATAFAQLLVPTPARRSLLMIMAIPAALLANAIRVTEIAVAAYLFGPQATSGWPHDYIGRGTWLLTIGGLFAAAFVLRGVPHLDRMPLRKRITTRLKASASST
jgi:exosortase